VKYDGFRTMAYAENGEATLVSRNGHVFSSRTYEPVRAAATALGADVILDGELVCLDADGMLVFNPLMWRRGTVYFHVFDCLWLNRDLSKLPLLVRKQILRRLVPDGTGPLVYGGARVRLGDDHRGQRRSVLANDSKGTSSCRRLHHPPGVQSGTPAVPLKGGPFERPGNRYGQCGPIGRAQDAVVGVQTAPS
jgi:hypothetical protein